MAKSDKNEKKDLPSILRNLVFFIAVYLYFIGWIYEFYYYRNFGIPLSALDIPVYYFFIFSYSAVEFKIIWYVILIGILILLVFIPRDAIRKWAIVFYMIILFPLSFYLAKSASDQYALKVRRGSAKTISFVLKGDASNRYPPEFLSANERGDLRFLTQTKDRFYVFLQPIDPDQPVLPVASSYIVPERDVSLVTIELPDLPK